MQDNIVEFAPAQISSQKIENLLKEPVPLPDLHIPNTELIQICDLALLSANRYAKITQAPETAIPSLNLRALSTLLEARNQGRKATEQDIAKELTRIEDVVSKEKEAMEIPELPTVGLEVEINKERLPFPDESYEIAALGHESEAYPKTHLIQQLERLGIKIVIEKSGVQPTEIIFPASFSAIAQNQMLQELQKIGVIPIDKSRASLHINLGYTHIIPDEDPYARTTSRRLSDVITYGFVTAERVKGRGHSTSVAVKDFDHDDLDILEKSNGEKIINRVEFRTPKVFGSTTFELIEKTQLVGTILSPGLEEIALSFDQHVNKLLNKYMLDHNLPQNDKIKAGEAIAKARALRAEDKPNLIDDAQQLMTYFSEKIRRKLYPQEFEETTSLAAD